MAGKKKNKDETPKIDTVNEAMSTGFDSPPTPKPAASGVPINVYFSLRKVKPGHIPGRLVYAQTKFGVTTKELRTPEEWDKIFKSY